MQQRDSKKRIAFPIQLFAEQNPVAIPDEINIVPTGKWDHPSYGEMEITSSDIAQFCANFKARIRRDIPITAGHDNGMSGGELPAIGWFKELIDRGVNGLWAVVEWTEEGKNLLAQRAFKYFSPEFCEQYSDPETGETYKNVLVGGALTNKPYFKELAPVVAFSEPSIIHQFSNMELNDIIAKNVEDLTAEEKTFLREHSAELSDEQKATFEPALKDEETPAPEEKPEEEPAPAPVDEPTEQVDASEKNMVKIAAAELAILKDKADKGASAFAELETVKLGQKADTLVFSETNKDGKFLPTQKTALVSFLKTLSETQRDQFTNLIKHLPKAAENLFSEKGDAGKVEVPASVFAEVEAKVKDAQKADSTLTYSNALRKVFSENPDLAKKYASEPFEATQDNN